MKCSTYDFIHPEDRKARMHLESVPGFKQLAKTLMKIYDERVFQGVNMAQKIRISDKQLPEIYRYLKLPVERLGIIEPELYLEMNPAPNAYTYGDTKIFITVTSGLMEYLDEDEIQAVFAHECGHIACRHTLYGTMARYLINYGLGSLGLPGKAMYPAVLALLYWYRRSEFSADRAAAVVMEDHKPLLETLIRLSGGPKSVTQNVNIELYAQQAEAFNDELDRSWWSKVLMGMQVMMMSHPFSAVRAREIQHWCTQDEFKTICMGEESSAADSSQEYKTCGSCGKSVDKTAKFCRFCGESLSL